MVWLVGEWRSGSCESARSNDSQAMASSTATLAARIRRHRIRSGMTQVVFARKLGVSQQKLSDWERGKRLRAVVEAMTLVRTLEKKG